VSKPDIAALRRHYADRMTAPVGPEAAAIRAAFARVPREDFLGPPPWELLGGGFAPAETSDVAELYQDVLVVLSAAKGINNGSPSLHAHMLHLLGTLPGEHVLHVGAGGGYYTAILAELVGASGRVTAVEFDAALAAQARANLRAWPQVTVHLGDGAAYPTEDVQRIYVSFGLARPADAWLDHLAVGGVLLVPLGAPHPEQTGARRHATDRAALLRVARTATGYAARFDTAVSFVFAAGPTAGDAVLRTALWRAFGRGGLERVHSLHRTMLPEGVSWVRSEGFSLGFAPP